MKPLKTTYLGLLVGAWLVVVVLAGVVLSIEPGRDTMANRFGEVAWDHELHARDAVKNCQSCHHTSHPGESDPQACRNCHKNPSLSDSVYALAMTAKKGPAGKVEKEVPSRRKAFHKSCIGCHTAVAKGPVACRECHMQVFPTEQGSTGFDHIGYAIENEQRCESCHEKGKPANLKGAEWDNCASCHAEGHIHAEWDKETPFNHYPLFAGTGGEVVWDHRGHILEHMDFEGRSQDCQSCHHMDAELSPQAYRRCDQCHKAADSEPMANGKVIPSRKRALHGVCLDCHDARDRALPEEMPKSCNDCHRKALHYEESRFGLITWSHDAHGNNAGVGCTYCHHTDPEEGPMQACSECHFEGQVGNFKTLKNLTHTNCVNCHSLERADVQDMLKWKNIRTCDACHVAGPKANLNTARATYLAKHGNLTLQSVTHSLCWKCHKQSGAGPGADNCRGCHAYPRARQTAYDAMKQAETEPEELTLPEVESISPMAYQTHRMHVDVAGIPCFDCHHNMRPSENAKRILKDFNGPTEGCKIGGVLDDCRPQAEDPQHCANCHGQAAYPISGERQALSGLCNGCHQEFGLELPMGD